MRDKNLPDDMLDMDEIVRLVEAKGVHAYVEMTGGGVATIFAGEQHVYPEVDGEWPRWDVAAGPGTYNHRDYHHNVGDKGDFYVGADDDGESGYITAPETATEEMVADVIVAMVRVRGQQWDDRFNHAMDEDEWEATYYPVGFPDGSDDPTSETYLIDRNIALGFSKRNVWSVIERNDRTYVVAGLLGSEYAIGYALTRGKWQTGREVAEWANPDE